MGSKRCTVTIVIAILFASTTVGCIQFASAQSGTLVGGAISSDTVWTKANSPYQLTSNMVVEKGVTLTIESGVTVSFTQSNGSWVGGYPVEYYYNYGLEIDGTLKVTDASFINQANGRSTGPGYSSGIFFSETSFNSTITNVSFSEDFPIRVNCSSTTFFGDKMQSVEVLNASPTIKDCTLQGNFLSIGGAPIFQGNFFSGISVFSGSPIICNNTYRGKQWDQSRVAIGLGSNLNDSLTAIISDNHIEGSFTDSAIEISSGNSIIERNFISGGVAGIKIYGSASPWIENNTIAKGIGINVYNDSTGSPSPTITGNNFEQCCPYNVALGQQGILGTTAPDVIVSNNWWGTTDTTVIGQTIYDHKNNNNLGTVTFNPILTSENKNAFPSANPETNPVTTPVSTPNSPSKSPTSPANSPYASTTPVQNELVIPQALLYSVIVVLSAVIAVLSIAFIVYRRKVTVPTQK